MQEFHVTDFESLHDALEPYRASKVWLFRGHSDASWELLPKAGRPPYSSTDDANVFGSWKRRAVEYISIQPQSDWDWLAVAQHHGLATRLLDWTTNPLIAAFFAVREQRPGQAIVYAANFVRRANPERTPPMMYSGVGVFYPRGVVPRITRQGGLFTIHSDPAEPLEHGSEYLHNLQKIVIHESYRSTLMAQLAFYGINSLTLFPDLDGLSTFLNWTVESQEYWNLARSVDSLPEPPKVPPFG